MAMIATFYSKITADARAVAHIGWFGPARCLISFASNEHMHWESVGLGSCPHCRGLLWTFYKMWVDNGYSLRGNDFQRTMQQLDALMMGTGFDALLATG
jgi:hypothetical protein